MFSCDHAPTVSLIRGIIAAMATARVLIVDDEPFQLNAFTKILSRSGYEAIAAGGALQALEIVRGRLPIDVVLSDVNMPGMPGTELIRAIGQLSPGSAC